LSNADIKKREATVEQNVKHSGPGEQHPEIMDAIENLLAKMSRVEPDLAREDARQAIRRTVNELLKDAG
jgi:flagellar basal body-associated protein FliL